MKEYITLALCETVLTKTRMLCAAPAYRIKTGDTVIAEKDDHQALCRVFASKIARIDECGFELALEGKYCDVRDLPRITAKARDIGDPFQDEPSPEDEDGSSDE